MMRFFPSFERLRHLVPVASCALILLTGRVKAGDFPWYAQVMYQFEQAGYLRAPDRNNVTGYQNSPDIEPSAPASRGRVLELLLKLKGGVVHGPFPAATFDDVPPSHSLFYVFEEAALQGWILGDGMCAGTHPCMAFPERPINRAEAATLLNRVFSFASGSSIPQFEDIDPAHWYSESLQVSASRCIFRGDDESGTLRPSSSLNQAEMLVVLWRSFQELSYPNCAPETHPLPQAPESLYMQIALPAPMSPSSSAFSSQIQTSSGQASSLTSSAQNISGIPILPLQNSTTSSSSASALPADSSDPNIAWLLSTYDTYVMAFWSFLDRTKSPEYTTNLQIVNVLKTQMTTMATYYQYISVARQRPLTEGEREVLSVVMQTIERGFESMRALDASGAIPLK